MRIWVVPSALLAGAGAAIVVAEGYAAISNSGGDSNIIGLFAGAGTGFSGMGLLVQALEGKLERFPNGAPGSQVAGLRREAIGYGLGVGCLTAFLVAFGGLAIAGTISHALSVAVMWFCFLGVVTLIAQIGHVKREALRVTQKQ